MSERTELLNKINDEVNAIPYVHDPVLYSLPDFWQRISDAGKGDCEDYALEKRARLLEAGVPLEELRLACCYVETGEYHAILIAADPDEGGDWVLDNRFHTLLTLDELKVIGYKGSKIQLTNVDAWEEWQF